GLCCPRGMELDFLLNPVVMYQAVVTDF
ncbi:hypothetical protein G955_02088, partial [Escherichia coli UMEA 3257-1]